MRIIAAILTLLGVLSATIASTLSAQPASPPVPERYRALYAELDADLRRVERYAAALPASAPDGPQPRVNVELLTANSNRGEALLAPETLPAVALTLDRLQAIGVSGVTLSINYPLLAPDFPRADEYLAFYRQVAALVRERGLALVVETSTIFPDFSTLPVNYEGLTAAAYTEGKRAMAALVARDLRPDFLTVESEPGTITRNTGVAYAPEAFAEHVNAVTAGLDRSAVRVGAGAGTWDDPAYFRALAENTDLDYIDMHIYPVGGELMTARVARIVEMARAGGKGVSVGEAWLYKAGRADSLAAPGTEATIFARDAFSFWSPLDARFMSALVDIARADGFAFVSFYWMTYLFGTVDYTPRTAEAPYAALSRLAANDAWRNIQAGVLTPTGEALHAALASH